MSQTYSPTKSSLPNHSKVSTPDPNTLSPTHQKHPEYVFRVLHRRSTTTTASNQQPQTDNNLTEIRNFFHKYSNSNSTHTPSQKEPKIDQSVSLDEENKYLRTQVQDLTEENKRLKEQCGRVQELEREKAGLQREIQRIKNEYVQTSLDAFQESLMPYLQNISVLKATIDSQNTLRESLQSALAEAQANNLSLVTDFKATIFKLEVEMRSQQQRFQVQLSDRDNQTRDLQRNLTLLQQKYTSLENELRMKDAFLMSLGQPRK